MTSSLGRANAASTTWTSTCSRPNRGCLRGIVNGLAGMVRERLAAGAVYDRLAAPELGGVVLGAGLSLELGLPLLLVRKAAKEYGTVKRIEGRFEPGERVAIIEDIVTSGGAAIQAAEALREAGSGRRRLVLRGGPRRGRQ